MRETGERDALDSEVAVSDSEPFWVDSLRRLVRRGLNGVQLVSSDAQER